MLAPVPVDSRMVDRARRQLAEPDVGRDYGAVARVGAKALGGVFEQPGAGLKEGFEFYVVSVICASPEGLQVPLTSLKCQMKKEQKSSI